VTKKRKEREGGREGRKERERERKRKREREGNMGQQFCSYRVAGSKII